MFGLKLTIALRVAAALSVVAPSLAIAADADNDGLDDGVEAALLARYRPYFLFAANEDKWPLPATTYVYNTEVKSAPDSGSTTLITVQQLRQDPLNVLQANKLGPNYCSYWNNSWFCKSDLTLNARPTEYALNALDSPPGGFIGVSPFTGFTPQAVQRIGNVGLYGHVVPTKLASPTFDCQVRWSTVDRSDPNKTYYPYYKVEYWQFFGFNDAHHAGFGNHEGDWTSVQLLIRPAAVRRVPCGMRRMCPIRVPEAVAAVMMYAHGKEFRFAITGNPPDRTWSQAGQTFGEFHGANYGKSVSIDTADGQCDTSMVNAQDNTLRMVQDSAGGWTHPVVYIERGAHEFWPTESWNLWDKIGGIKYYAPAHNGDGVQFLTATPPNLGEVEAPLDNSPNTLIVLRYNGHWGADNSYNTPPQGPPLHGQWTWPANSSIGWQLPKKWLGLRSTAEAESVRDVLVRSRSFAGGVTFLCAVASSPSGAYYAYVRPDRSFVIVLGSDFTAAPTRGFSSKGGTLVHEISHFTLAGAANDPKIYGAAAALSLALSNPNAAQHSAENIEYFVEAVGYDL